MLFQNYIRHLNVVKLCTIYIFFSGIYDCHQCRAVEVETNYILEPLFEILSIMALLSRLQWLSRLRVL